jgi:hypothetical protein
MAERDNCPKCKTICPLQIEAKIAYATCKTCKTKWRRREDTEVPGGLIYEIWACRIPEMNIPFPFVGGGIKLPKRSCRWKKVKEVHVSAPKNGTEFRRKVDEITSIKANDYAGYYWTLSKGDKIKGEISSDACIDIWFLDEMNYQKFHKRRRFEEEDGTIDVYEAKSLEFTAPRKGVWYVVLNSKNKTRIKVTVHLYALILPKTERDCSV